MALCVLSVGTHIRAGFTELIIFQLGKVCHNPCAIYHQAGDCVMPREGIFGIIIEGGEITVGDEIEVLSSRSTSAAIIGSAETEREFGERLRTQLEKKWQPGFIRFDWLKPKEDNHAAVLDDLIDTQQVDRILIFDPSGKHTLALAGRTPAEGVELYYCRTLEEVTQLQVKRCTGQTFSQIFS